MIAFALKSIKQTKPYFGSR